MCLSLHPDDDKHNGSNVQAVTCACKLISFPYFQMNHPAAYFPQLTFDLTVAPHYLDRIEFPVFNHHPTKAMVYTWEDFYFSGVFSSGQICSTFPALEPNQSRTHTWLTMLGRHREPRLPRLVRSRSVAFRCNFVNSYIDDELGESEAWDDLPFRPHETHRWSGTILVPPRVTPYYCFQYWIE